MLSTNKAGILFASALLLVSVSGLTALLAISQILNSQGWVTHTQEVRVAIAEVNTLLSRAGRTRTEYIESGDPLRQREYETVLGDIPPALELLKHLTKDNSVEQERCAAVDQLIEQRLILLRQSVALKSNGQSTLEKQAEINQKIIAVARQQDTVLQQMQDTEESLLDTRARRLRARERLAVVLLSCSLITALLFLILHYRLLKRELEDRQHAQTALRTLSARILQIQDEERRKFSRELHDSLGQYLVGAKMTLDMLDRSTPGNSLVADCNRLITDALSETRTISHLLHPPLLDEAGFASAARWYLEGFSARSGIATRIDIPDPWNRLPPLVEIAMFRVLQEGLTNIHKHSQSSQAEISVQLQASHVRLTLRDQGKGIPARVLDRFRNEGGNNGVGLAGMRERVRELGGFFEIHSGAAGTVIAVMLPIPKTSPPAQPSPPRATEFQPNA